MAGPRSGGERATSALQLKQLADGRRRAARHPSGKETPQPIWNSLERAKIAVGVFTSLSVVGLGAVVTISNASAERNLQKELRKEVSDEKRQADLDALARDDQRALQATDNARKDREAARREAEHVSDRDFVRQRALQEDASRRELALRSQSDAREDEIQEKVRKRELAAALYNRRRELWAKVDADAISLLEAAESILLTDRSGGEASVTDVTFILDTAMRSRRNEGPSFTMTFDLDAKNAHNLFMESIVEFVRSPSDGSFLRLQFYRSELERAVSNYLIPPEAMENYRDQNGPEVVAP